MKAQYSNHDFNGNPGVATLSDGTVLVCNQYEGRAVRWYNQRTRQRGSFDGKRFVPAPTNDRPI